MKRVYHRLTATREVLAVWEDLPDDLMAELARDRDVKIRRMVASRIRIPDDVLTILAGDEDTMVRSGIADRALEPETWQQLLASPEPAVLRQLLYCPTLPAAETLQVLNIVSTGQPLLRPLVYVIDRDGMTTELFERAVELDHDCTYVAARRCTDQAFALRLAQQPGHMVVKGLLANPAFEHDTAVIDQLCATWNRALEEVRATLVWEDRLTGMFTIAIEGILNSSALTTATLGTLPATAVLEHRPDRLTEGCDSAVADTVRSLSVDSPRPLAEIWEAASLLVAS